MTLRAGLSGLESGGICLPNVRKASDLCFTNKVLTILNFNAQGEWRAVDSAGTDRKFVLSVLLNANTSKAFVRNTKPLPIT